VLILAPLGRDAAVIAQVLETLAHERVVCASLAELVERLDDETTVAVLTEETLRDAGSRRLGAWIEGQPAWSDLPFVVLATKQTGRRSAQATAALAALGNSVLLERPLNSESLASAVRSAMRSRGRQYDARRHLLENQRLYQAEHQARAEADAANRAKDEFLATLSHELRTPLSAILGWATVLQRHRAQLGDLARGVDTIERNAKAQARLIEDLLDMSRIVAGRVDLEWQSVVPATLIEQVVAAVMPSSQAKRIRIEQDVDAAALPILADPQRLQQVLWNLLTNAIKFTPEGGTISIEAGVTDHFELTIADTGAGITADFLPHVFDRFRQADGSTTRSHGGLGLGLAIVKKLVELHGGTVTARSAGLGAGAVFTVRLPLSDTSSIANWTDAEADEGSRHAVDASIRDFKVLLVEDDRDGREMVARLLTDAGGQVRAVASGREALQALDEQRFDVVVSDIGMPGMDGYELLERIRAGGNAVPAVALTAFARAEDKAKALEAGYQAHLTKPVKPSALTSAMAQVAGAGSPKAAER